MKSYLLLFCFIASSLGMAAQSISITPMNVSATGTPDDPFKGIATITNNTSGTLTLTWERTANNLATGWASAVCDANGCWAPHVNSKSITLGAGQDSDLSIFFYPQGNLGTTDVEVHIYAESDSANINLTNTYTGTAVMTSVKGIQENNIKVFPNPTTNYFMLSEIGDAKSLEIYSIVGRKVKTQAITVAEQKFYMNDLPNGTYIIRLLDKKGHIVKATKIKKR